MAEDSDLDRTEPASPRRLEQAREKGQVAHSRELPTFAVLLSSGAVLVFMGSQLSGHFVSMMRDALTVDRNLAFTPALMSQRLYDLSFQMLVAFLPFILVVFIVALTVPMLISGWLFTFQALQPKFDRLSPLKGLGRMFSWTSVVELAKAIAKTILIGGVSVWFIVKHQNEMLAVLTQPLDVGIMAVAHLVGLTFLTVVGSMILIVAIDVPFQLWDYHRQLRMTRNEVRQEAKESEGDPQIKARIRALQREAARRRMMSEVPKADVIVTNPTRFAIALRYREDSMRAPQVIAKGTLLLAERILELARENRIPVLEAPPLARALYRNATLGQEIPAALYTAVAQVMAYIFQLRQYQTQGGVRPETPRNLPVPTELDPEAVAQ